MKSFIHPALAGRTKLMLTKVHFIRFSLSIEWYLDLTLSHSLSPFVDLQQKPKHTHCARQMCDAFAQQFKVSYKKTNIYTSQVKPWSHACTYSLPRPPTPTPSPSSLAAVTVAIPYTHFVLTWHFNARNMLFIRYTHSVILELFCATPPIQQHKQLNGNSTEQRELNATAHCTCTHTHTYIYSIYVQTHNPSEHICRVRTTHTASYRTAPHRTVPAD